MELHEYQKRIANFVAQHPHCILSVDMGLGKTAAVLAWLDWYERKNGYNARVVIIAPKRIAEHQWKQEADKWSFTELSKRMSIVAGSSNKRIEALHDCTKPIKVISRENLRMIERTKWDAIILDELTSFKSVQTTRTKAVMELQAPIKIGLTGTFLANGAIDIFGQCAAVGLKWGVLNFYAWRAMYFRDALAGSGLHFHRWKLQVPLVDLLHSVQSEIFTLTADDYLKIPHVSETTHKVQMSDEVAAAILDLDSFLSMELNGERLTFEEGQKFAKLQTLCNGFVYTDSGEAKRGAESVKLRAVCDFVEDCKDAGEHVLLFYAFREEEAWLTELLKARKIVTASVREKDFLKRWNDGDIDCLLAHPASAGHGLNLQHGGRILVWSTLTYNYEYFAQANARLARQGQKRNVQIHYFIAKDTCEERVVRALQKKDKEQKLFLNITKQ